MTRNRIVVWLASVALGFVCGLAGVAQGASEPGADHPMISRYPGSKMIEYRQQQFEKIQLATGFAENVAQNKRAEPTLREFEGKATTIIYEVVGNQSAREVFRNYEQALARAGLKTLLSCFNETCGNRISIALFRDNWREPLYRGMLYDSIDNSTSDFGYVSATGTAKGVPLAAGVFIARIRTGNRVYIGLDIMEGEPMKTDQVIVNLDQLTTDIREQGKVILSGIFFDTDKDVVKPESGQALQVIADYLKRNPQQSFFVVGHSDTAGSYDYNVGLSQRRAQAVVAALTSKYAVAKPRLTAVGIGPVSPAGTNANDVGRARNRRVELVLR